MNIGFVGLGAMGAGIVPRLMAAADIYCQPNTTPEPFGIAFVEALAAGVPVVTTAMGGPLEIVDDRHQRGSTIITSQVPVDHWHEVIADPTIADAVLDRLVHNAHRLVLRGDSMRKITAQTSTLDAVKKP